MFYFSHHKEIKWVSLASSLLWARLLHWITSLLVSELRSATCNSWLNYRETLCWKLVRRHTFSDECWGAFLTWRQCLLASQPMCWSCCGSGSAEASRNAFKVRAANAECKALNQTFASALSAALNQHSWTPSGECSSRMRPSVTERRKEQTW